MNITNWQVIIHSDLYVAGTDEEGRAFTADVYYLVIENKRGDRLAHCTTFPSCEAESHEGIMYFSDEREEARDAVENLRELVVIAGEINLEFWSPVDPGYGTQAYLDHVAQMTDEQRANY